MACLGPVPHMSQAHMETRGSCKTWTGFWTQLYYVIGQCKHGATIHV